MNVFRVSMRTVLAIVPASVLAIASSAGVASEGVRGVDYGDAPATRGYGRPSHVIREGVLLGQSVDGEDGNWFAEGARGDDRNGGALGGGDEFYRGDDDAVTLRTSGMPGEPWIVEVAASGANGLLQAWFDWDNNGQFDADEQYARDLRDIDGDGRIEFPLYGSADAQAVPTYARFRWSTMAGLDAVSPAPDGEVEDYQFRIIVPGAVAATGPQTIASVPAGIQPAMAAIPAASMPSIAAAAPAVIQAAVPATGALGSIGLGGTTLIAGALGAAAIVGIVAVLANNDSSSDTKR